MDKSKIENNGYSLDPDGFYYKKNAPKVGVICSCGNDKFILRYGYYCIYARCSECGKENEVYSG